MPTTGEPHSDNQAPNDEVVPAAGALETATNGPRHAAKKSRRRIWPRKRWVQIVLSLGIVLVLIVGAAAGYAYYQSKS